MKQALKNTKRSTNYLESTVTRSLQEHFQNTIYPIILENISISEDGELRNTKSTGSTTDIQDNSMTSESYYRECREEHAFKLKNYRKDKSVSVKVINKALMDLHFWIQNWWYGLLNISGESCFSGKSVEIFP